MRVSKGVAGVPGEQVEVATLVGSLRRQSFNRGLLRTAMLLQPEGMHIYEVPIEHLPHYDEDVDRHEDPPPVRDLKQALQRADAILILTPEYNYSIPGVLKNALDWASRPSGRSVLRGKPAAIMGAAAGRSGTMRAQLHLRDILLTIGLFTLPEPEVYVTFAADKFNSLGELTDQSSLDGVRQLLRNLHDWTR